MFTTQTWGFPLGVGSGCQHLRHLRVDFAVTLRPLSLPTLPVQVKGKPAGSGRLGAGAGVTVNIWEGMGKHSQGSAVRMVSTETHRGSRMLPQSRHRSRVPPSRDGRAVPALLPALAVPPGCKGTSPRSPAQPRVPHVWFVFFQGDVKQTEPKIKKKKR